ncbi:hypothetical protein [uncultured Pelagimonas sp.]|uniref:hypothetical protein n=1 Tax=uncultured Pelagimonas sp. TaxID=1618102 RepID=UPI0026090073|nr:hypothetical protein [uncultured Pelagimonas sp.]
MKGWLIFKHSFSMVLRNWQEAVKIGLLPVLMIVGLAMLVLRGAAFELMQGTNPEDMEHVFTQPGLIGGFTAVWLFAMFAILTVIVSWHRFVLLEEYPESWVPKFRTGVVLGYFGRMLLIGILALVMMIPLGLVAGMMMAIPGLGWIALIAAYLCVAIVIYRVIAILPAAAIGEPITLGRAFEATKGANIDIFVLMLVSFGVNIVFQLAVGAVAAVSPILSGVLSIPVSLALALVNVSVLTTFYGHYIQGRPID